MFRLFARVALLLLLATPAFAQQPANLTPFFGRYVGSGLSAGEDIAFLGVTRRDLDIDIRAAGEGFTTRWITVLRTGPSRDEIRTRQRESEATFAPVADRPGLYRATQSGDLFAGQSILWARVVGTTMIINEIALQPDGRLAQGIYTRTLNQGGMLLQFTRVVDGERTRVVRGRLTRQ